MLKDNQVWIGYGSPCEFGTPDGTVTKRVTGLGRWFTNVDIKKRYEPLTVFRRYHEDPSKFPKYDNYDAINVDKVADIPEDYMGVMGVPITFLDKYCPDQFEILWTASGHFKTSCPSEIQEIVGYSDLTSDMGTKGYCILSGHQMYHRLLIRRIQH